MGVSGLDSVVSPVHIRRSLGIAQDIQPRHIRPVLGHGLAQREQRPLGLGHLLALQRDESVHGNGFGPEPFWEYGHVMVEEEEQVICDEILARGAQVYRIPVGEVVVDLLHRLLRQARLAPPQRQASPLFMNMYSKNSGGRLSIFMPAFTYLARM